MHKFKTYAKLIGILLLVLFIVHFMWSNKQTVTLRLFWRDIFKEVPMFYVILGAASGGIFIFLIARKFRKLIADLRQIRKEEKTKQKLVSEIKAKVEQEQNVKTQSTGKEASHETN